MVHKLLAISALACLLMVIGQGTLMGQGTLTTTGVGVPFAASGPPPVPGFISFSGMPSTEAGTWPSSQSFSGTGFCPSDAYCAQAVDAVASGDSVLVVYTYKAASGNTANTPTASDDKSDSSVHCGTDGNQSTNDTYFGCFYFQSPTAGARAFTLTWTTNPTQVAVGVYSFFNTGAIDGYNSNSGTSTTSWTTGSVTSGQANDMYVSCAVGTSTRTAVAAFTVGSNSNITWNADLNDRRDAGVCESGDQTVSGALNPAITAGTSNNFVGITVALKAASSASGSAPTGMYVDHIYHVSSATGTSNLSYSVPTGTSSNLVAVIALGGGSSGNPQTITAVSDTTNSSWKQCGPNNSYNITNAVGYYIANATPAASGLVTTMTVGGGSGDTGPSVFYSITGADTSQECHYAAPVRDDGNTASTETVMSNFAPSQSNGIALIGTSFDSNTALGTTVGGQDCNTAGGQSLSGGSSPPSVPDQNNGCSHIYITSNSPNNLIWNLLSNAKAAGSMATMVMALQAPSPTLYPVMVNHKEADTTTTGTTVSISSYVPVHAGDTLAIFFGEFGAACTTESVSDGGTNTYTAVDTLNGGAGGTGCEASFYAKNISSSTVTITATGPSNSQRNIKLVEFANVSTTAPLDQHNLVSVTTTTDPDGSSDGLASGTAVTPSSANEVAFGAVWCNNSCLQSGTTGNGMVQPWTLSDGDASDNVAGFYAIGSTAGIATKALDSQGTGATDKVGIMTFH